MKRRALSLPFVLTAALSPSLALADTSTGPKLPRAVHPERVTKQSDGKCYEYPDVHCPPNVHCNPGPPTQVECPPEPKKP